MMEEMGERNDEQTGRQAQYGLRSVERGGWRQKNLVSESLVVVEVYIKNFWAFQPSADNEGDWTYDFHWKLENHR